jgi:metallo-beta-lactamase family protein
MQISLQFLGAAETVTGSKHLLNVAGRKFLIDCGLFQGTPELKERNWQPLPVNAHEIEAVILTHAHIDHIGYLPRLYAEGYRGPVFCTGATREITRISLADSAHLQEESARYLNRKQLSRHKPALPLYTIEDAQKVSKLMEERRFDVWQDLGRRAKYRFRRAGHILGSAFVEFQLPDERTVLFGGDLGRKNQPIIRDPDVIEAADFLLVESTYGDREHPETPPAEFLAEAIKRIVQTGGVMVVPAFSIGRTQDMLHYLRDLELSGDIPDVPVYVDSPMGVDATNIYARHHEDHDLEMEEAEKDGTNPLSPKRVVFVRKQEESKRLNALQGPAIVISSSGMATGGRVVHHLLRRLGEPENIVMFVGYQASGTLGRALVDGAPEVGILGERVRVRAEVRSLGSLSAHADASDILDWLGGFTSPPKRTFIVHGEPNPQRVLQARIAKELGWDCHIPAHEELCAL